MFVFEGNGLCGDVSGPLLDLGIEDDWFLANILDKFFCFGSLTFLRCCDRPRFGFFGGVDEVTLGFSSFFPSPLAVPVLSLLVLGVSIALTSKGTTTLALEVSLFWFRTGDTGGGIEVLIVLVSCSV